MMAAGPRLPVGFAPRLLPLKDNIPTVRFPIVTIVLIAINVAVFAWQTSLSDEPGSSISPHVQGLSESDERTLELGAIPYRLTHPGTDCGVRAQRVVCGDAVESQGARPLDAPPWWATVLTSMFLHGGLLHIAGNMLFLWVFGNNVEDAMGRLRFIAFYLLAGTVAVYAQALLDTASTTPTIGASGAVAGVLGGYILLHPHARVVSLVVIIFFVTLVEIPALILLGIWFALQFLPAVGQVATQDLGGEGVAYLAHVGGFAFGLAMIKLFTMGRRDEPALRSA